MKKNVYHKKSKIPFSNKGKNRFFHFYLFPLYPLSLFETLAKKCGKLEFSRKWRNFPAICMTLVLQPPLDVINTSQQFTCSDDKGLLLWIPYQESPFLRCKKTSMQTSWHKMEEWLFLRTAQNSESKLR